MTTELDIDSNTDLKLKEDNLDSKTYEELKPGEYYLSTLQSMLINKQLPLGYKLELEDSYFKSLDEIKKQNQDELSHYTGKRKKNNVSYFFNLTLKKILFIKNMIATSI